MASRKVRYEFESKNFQAVDNTFDKLTKKEQEAIVKGSKLGKVLEDAGNKGKKGGDKVNAAFKGVANQMLGAMSASSILSKALDANIRRFEKIKELQTDGDRIQRSYAESIGKVADNMRDAFTPKARAGIESFIKDQGKRLGEGGIDQVADALATVTSKVGTSDFNQDQIKQAIATQVNLRAKGLPVDIAAGATANLMLGQAAGVGPVAAENMLSVFGAQAGENAALFGPSIPGALKSGEAAGIAPSQTLAMMGFISQRLQKSPEETATILNNLLGKSDPLRLQKLGINLKSEDRMSQLIEIMKRAQSGEFGAEKHKVLTTAGLRGAFAEQVSSLIANESKGFRARVEQMEAARRDPKNIAEIAASNLGTQAKFAQVGKLIKGTGEKTKAEDIELSIREKQVNLLTELESKFGVGLGMEKGFVRTGAVDLSEDYIKKIITTSSDLSIYTLLDEFSRTQTQEKAVRDVRFRGVIDDELKIQISALVKLIQEERGKAKDEGGQ